ncbi:hypothetical protein PQR46_32355 [Paraburkholderia sediminicola]|uniref:hypothetical protein n=1 Tax=Paraburkholderia sediminicola TaxID=458836 RepID=UPI0038B7A29E
MDIRQIQALHAQYSPHPVVIDIAGHASAMPALPAPERGPSPRFGREWNVNGVAAKLRKAGRPALLCLAIATIAGGGGMSAAKIWRVMHDGAAAPVYPVERAAAAPAQAPVISESAINAAPARPLTASDFGQQPAVTSALASVDPRSLVNGVQKAAPTSGQAGDNATNSTLAQAAASSIHVQRPAPPAQPVVVQAVAQAAPVAPSAPVRPTATAQAQQAVVPGPATASERTASAAEAPAVRPVLRPIRHLNSHHATVAASEPPATPAAPTQTAPAKAPAAKGGDVQLF